WAAAGLTPAQIATAATATTAPRFPALATKFQVRITLVLPTGAKVSTALERFRGFRPSRGCQGPADNKKGQPDPRSIGYRFVDISVLLSLAVGTISNGIAIPRLCLLHSWVLPFSRHRGVTVVSSFEPQP